MTVKDLLDVAPQIVVVEVTIRNNGRYCYRWEYGKHIQLPSGYTIKGYYTHYELEEGERMDFPQNQFPATFVAEDARELDKEVLELEITDIRLTHPFRPWLYKYVHDEVGWDAVEAVITCDIGNREYKKPHKTADIIKDQMSIDDYLGVID